MCAAGKFRLERTRPIGAPYHRIVERLIPAEASSGQEDGIPVGTCDQLAVHAVTRRRYPGALLTQLVLLRLGRHSPRRPPVHEGGIILWIQLGLAIYCAIVAVHAVLSLRGFTAITPLVITPVIEILGGGLTSGEVVAVFLRSVDTHVHCRPQRAAGQT